jgi:hypothetical protein
VQPPQCSTTVCSADQQIMVQPKPIRTSWLRHQWRLVKMRTARERRRSSVQNVGRMYLLDSMIKMWLEETKKLPLHSMSECAVTPRDMPGLYPVYIRRTRHESCQVCVRGTRVLTKPRGSQFVYRMLILVYELLIALAARCIHDPETSLYAGSRSTSWTMWY